MLSIASLHIHPIKSLGGFAVNEARITDRGFEHDRRWMLVDENGIFISQREVPMMACLHCVPIADGFRVTDIRDGDALDLPWSLDGGVEAHVKVWDDAVAVLLAPIDISAWFSHKLGITAVLVFMPDGSTRPANEAYAIGLTSLSDGFPYLILSQASLDDLNARGTAWAHERMSTWASIPMDRFRPNIVIAGGEAFQEDAWKEIAIGAAVPDGSQVRFSLVKPCFRCPITTTDQRTGERGKEPLRTLATFRREGNEVRFGMNAMAIAGEVVRVGDLVNA